MLLLVLLLAPGSVLALQSASIQHISHSAEEFTSPSTYSLIGCYKDGYPVRDLPNRHVPNALTAAKCAEECKDYAYFGTQYGYECYCGDTYGTYGEAGGIGPSTSTSNACDSPCGGDADEICGGHGTNSIYAFVASGSGSAAKGDPHLMNVKGEAFDVMQTGNMMLLEIPRGSSPATLDLALHADIERLGVVSCGPTFITSASITGRWIGVPLEIRSGPMARGGAQSKRTFAIRLDGKDWLPHAEMQRTIELSEGATIIAQDRRFLFQVRGLDIAVSQPKRPRIFLDIQVQGLGNLKTEIGGLLGIDDHSSVEELPSACEMSPSPLSLAAMAEDEALRWSARALL